MDAVAGVDPDAWIDVVSVSAAGGFPHAAKQNNRLKQSKSAIPFFIPSSRFMCLQDKYSTKTVIFATPEKTHRASSEARRVRAVYSGMVHVCVVVTVVPSTTYGLLTIGSCTIPVVGSDAVPGVLLFTLARSSNVTL